MTFVIMRKKAEKHVRNTLMLVNSSVFVKVSGSRVGGNLSDCKLPENARSTNNLQLFNTDSL